MSPQLSCLNSNEVVTAETGPRFPEGCCNCSQFLLARESEDKRRTCAWFCDFWVHWRRANSPDKFPVLSLQIPWSSQKHLYL